MLYLAIVDGEVRIWLDHSPARADVHTFADVLAGSIDMEVRGMFGEGVLAELKEAVRDRAANPPGPFDKQADMLRRRREG